VSVTPYRNAKSPRDCRKQTCTREQQTYFYWYNLTFWTRPENLLLLKSAGFTLMGTANNHVEDQGPQGLLDTITHLKAAGLFHAGTGATEAEAWTPYLFEKQGVKVAVLAVTALHNLPASRKGAFFAASLHPAWYTELPAKVRDLKKNVDFVVVALHYGKELETRTIALEQKLVESLEAAGCDLFIGGHPHVLRGIGVHRKMAAFYSMGNFLFLINVGTRVETGVAVADFVKDAKGKRVENIAFHPVLANGGALGNLPRAVTGPAAKRVLINVKHYSKQFNNPAGTLEIDGDRLVVKPGN
jgi:poly-gamma-glutamate capsule biosynthesis protein CapA/YwtB (metallophosphatase superfamily)